MRSIPGVLFLFGVSMWQCSVFPEQAPVVGHSQGGAGGRGTGGAKDGGRGDTGVDTDSQAPSSGGGGGTGGVSGSGATAGSGGNADAGDAARPDGDATWDGSNTQTESYIANVADCLEAVVAPQKGSCLSYSTLNDGPNELWVDIRRTGRRAFTTYLSFPVDAAIANHTVLSLELRVTVTGYPNAPGTGADVWEVVPFDATSLYVQVPAVVGTAPLARTPGPALREQTVTYSLPARLAKPNTPVSLSLTLPNTGDGTGYWGTNGNSTNQPPPTLVITYR